MIGYVGILRDVTASRVAQAEHERLAQRLRGALARRALDSIVIAERVLDEDGRRFDLVRSSRSTPVTARLIEPPAREA